MDKYFVYLVMLTIVDLFDGFEFFVLCFACGIFHDIHHFAFIVLARLIFSMH